MIFRVFTKTFVAGALAFVFTAGATSLVVPETAEAATKKQRRDAMRLCKRKYGKTVFKVSFRRNGEIICHYGPRGGKNMTEEQVRQWCKRENYMAASVRVFKRNGRWWCEWRS